MSAAPTAAPDCNSCLGGSNRLQINHKLKGYMHSSRQCRWCKHGAKPSFNLLPVNDPACRAENLWVGNAEWNPRKLLSFHHISACHARCCLTVSTLNAV